MKEQLIRELVKTGRDSQMINNQNQHKIKALEDIVLSHLTLIPVLLTRTTAI